MRRIALWGAAAAAVWLPPLIGGRALFGDALFKLFYPYAEFFRRCILSGEFPFWNPHQLTGVPFAANMQSAVFYPPTWLNLVLAYPEAAAAGAWLHSALAGLFMAAWARRRGLSPGAAAGAGAVFAFNGFAVLHYAFPCQAAAYAWTPAAALCLEAAAGPRRRAWLAGAALALALQLLAGHPQFAVYSGAALLLLALFAEDRRRALTDLAAAGALAGGIAAAQLLPSWQLARLSPRASGLGYEWATQMSLPPGELARMLLTPQWNAAWAPAGGDPHIVGLYLGLPALALAAWGLGAGRAARPFALASGLGLMLALGRHLPGYHALYALLPPLSLFRFPAQWLALACFGAAALVGLGLERLASPRARWALAALCALDLWAFSQRAVTTLEREVFTRPTPLLAALARGGTERFMLTPRTQLQQSRPGRTPLEGWLGFKDTAVPNLATAYGLYDAFAYEELRLSRTDEALYRLAQDPRSPWLDVLGVRRVVSFWPLPEDKFRPLGRSTALLYENPDAFPKAYFASGARCVPEGDTLAAVESGPAAALLAAPVLGGSCPDPAAPSSAPVRTAAYGANRVELELEAPSAGWVVITDAWAPGWTARVDGRPAELRPANHVQRAVRVPARVRRVELRYRPPYFSAALLLSAASLALAAGLALYKPEI